MNTIIIGVLVSVALLGIILWLDLRTYPEYKEPPYTDHTEDWEKAVESLKK